MARGTAIETTLPDPEDETLDDEILIDPEDNPEGHIDGPDDEAIAIEAEARQQGWRPLAEFKGEPGTWKTARQFLDAGRQHAPFMRAQADRDRRENVALRAEVAGLRGEISEIKKLAESFRDNALAADKRGYDRAMAEVKAKQRQAAAEGNIEAYDAAEAEAVALAADAPAAKPPKEENPQPQPQGEIDPDIQFFVDSNKWFMTEPTLNNYMREVYAEVCKTMPGLSTPAALARAKTKVMERFPEKFGLDPGWKPNGKTQQQQPQQRRRSATVIDPSDSGAPPQRGREPLTFNSIEDPAERAQAIRAWQAQKRHMPDYTEEQYMRLYANPKADVLEGMQRKRRTAAQRAAAE